MDDLWEQYWADPTRENRNAVVMANMDIVYSAIRRYSKESHDMLFGYAVEGLIQAVERFKPEILDRFRPYAFRRVKGAILDGWREMDYLPRRARESITRYINVKESLAQKYGHSPNNAEVVKVLDLTDQERYGTAAAIDFATSRMNADEEWSDAIRDQDPLNRPDHNLISDAMRIWLGDAVSQLPERQKIVVTLYYYEGMNLREIGETFGLTEARICQIHKEAIRSLREIVNNDAMLEEIAV